MNANILYATNKPGTRKPERYNKTHFCRKGLCMCAFVAGRSFVHLLLGFVHNICVCVCWLFVNASTALDLNTIRSLVSRKQFVE